MHQTVCVAVSHYTAAIAASVTGALVLYCSCISHKFNEGKETVNATETGYCTHPFLAALAR